MKRAKTGTEELLQQMSGSVVPVEEPARAAARREKVVGRLSELHKEITARSARRRVAVKFAVVAAAAAGVLGLGAAWHTRAGLHPTAQSDSASRTSVLPALRVATGTVLVKRPGSTRAAPSSGKVLLSADARVFTQNDGRATATLPSGSTVKIAPLTELSMSSPEAAGWMHESVRLDRGRIDVHVLPLPPGGSFVVVTPDASVTVHGTRFTVIVEKHDGVLGTQVLVSEGHVLVRDASGQTLLAPGTSWTSHPPALSAPASSSASAVAAPPLKAPPRALRQPVGSAKAPTLSDAGGPARTTEQSTLAEQNRLYQAAMNARRRGDNGRALQLLDQLLKRYPGSPLEQDARVERFRALERLGQKDAAARAARRYLAEHPNGFAREEARRLALDPSSTSLDGPH